MQSALLGSEERRYRALFDLAPDAYLVTDRLGAIVEANARAAELLGMRPEQLIGKPLAGFVDRAERRRFQHVLAELREESSVTRLELNLRTRSRSIVVPVGATVARVDFEEPVLQWILHDLSARKHAEWEVLEREREQFVVLVEQLPAAVFVGAAPGGEFVFLNNTAKHLIAQMGLAEEDVRRFTDWPLLLADGSPCPKEQRPLHLALTKGERTNAERFAVRLAEGTLSPLEVSAAPLRDAKGTITRAVVVAFDVSVLDQRERAEREFVSNAAHQLRNPLAAIRSAVEVLQAGAKDDPAARDRFLSHIERESARLTRLARSLLVLARAQSQVEDPRRQIVQLAPLLHEIARRLIPPAGVALEVQCTPDLATISNLDLLEEAIACLADNAVRYTQEGRVLLRGHAENGFLTVEVRDEGPGIPTEIQDHMFERFSRGGSDRGFGLGLAIAAQAAEAIGAKLEIDSVDGAGTTARVHIPAARMLGP